MSPKTIKNLVIPTKPSTEGDEGGRRIGRPCWSDGDERRRDGGGVGLKISQLTTATLAGGQVALDAVAVAR